MAEDFLTILGTYTPFPHRWDFITNRIQRLLLKVKTLLHLWHRIQIPSFLCRRHPD